MRDRTVLVLELIQNPQPDRLLLEELGDYGHECDAPLATLTRDHLISMLRRYENSHLSANDLKAWAIRLMGRQDVEFEFGPEGAVEEALFWIAYEEIAEWESKQLCQHIERMLERHDIELP
jgi:hypothetical protein